MLTNTRFYMIVMEELNPLELTEDTLANKCCQRNKRGRPKSEKAIKFTPQPKSIISRLLRRIQNSDFNKKHSLLRIQNHNRKLETNNGETRRENEVHTKHSSIQELCSKSTNTPENVQKGITFELEDDHDNLKDNLVDGDRNNIQNTLCDKTCLSSPKLLEIDCYVCSHRSSSQQAHRKHLSTHKNQPYACNFPNCGYKSKYSCNLIKHRRIHTSEKPFLCDQCTFRSNFANSLKVHKRIHTSERPYGCQHCSYRCNSSSNLKKHCRHIHSNIS